MLGKIDSCATILGREFGVDVTRGSLTNQGRVKLFERKFPGTSKSGYCLRSRVIWWIYTGEALSGMEWNIHHKNHDRSDDRIENLEKIKHSDHTHEHHGYRWQNVTWVNRECLFCQKSFKIEVGKANEAGANRGKYCSQACYQKSPKNNRKLKEQVFCFRGHEYTEENTYWVNYKHAKRRSCKICRRENGIKDRERRKHA